jgi:hypothetical protein
VGTVVAASELADRDAPARYAEVPLESAR